MAGPQYGRQVLRPIGRKTKILLRATLALWVILIAATAPILLPVIPLGLILLRVLMYEHREPPAFQRSWWWHVQRRWRRLVDLRSGRRDRQF